MVETEHEALFAARACRYPPVGRRSLGQFAEPWARAEETPQAANERVVCAVMVETELGLANVDKIAATPGIDMILVGPFDLSLSLDQSLERTITAAGDGPLGAIIRACRAHDVIAGAFAGTVERAKALRSIGYQALALASDVKLLNVGAGMILHDFAPARASALSVGSNGI